MYLASSQPESRNTLSHERGTITRDSEPFPTHPSHIQHHPPAPVEPRSNTYFFTSSQSISQPPHDIFNKPAAVSRSESMKSSQTLPRIHDLLNSESPTLRNTDQSTAWTNPAFNSYARSLVIRNASIDPCREPETKWTPAVSQIATIPHREVSDERGHDFSSGVHPRTLSANGSYASRPGVLTSPFAANLERSPVVARHDSVHHNSRDLPLTNGSYPSGEAHGNDDVFYRRPISSTGGQSAVTPSTPGVHDPSRAFVRTAEVPGEGIFHFYRDGKRIPAHVDGETVNPVWGLTKANKPRKRLAMACLDCREKKIKCDPGLEGCVQCEKAKRQCRTSHNQSSQSDVPSPNSDIHGSLSPPRRGTSETLRGGSYDERSVGGHKRRSRAQPSPTTAPTKKQRSTSPSVSSDRMSEFSLPNGHGPVACGQARQLPAALFLGDPFVQDYASAHRAFELFLRHFNTCEYRIFPGRQMSHWVRTSRNKTESECMILHAALAAGSIFDPENLSAFGAGHAEAALRVLHQTRGNTSLATVQTRLLLALHYISTVGHVSAAEHVGTAITAALGLQYHTERGCESMSGDVSQYTDFGLTRHQLVECKRRTLWSCFLLDRYHSTSVSLINSQDIFLRLPQTDESYEEGAPSGAPHFACAWDHRAEIPLRHSTPVSSMAWLISIAAIWGEVRCFLHRSRNQRGVNYADNYERFYENTYAVLQDWMVRLPEELHFSPDNLYIAARGGYLGPLVSIHVLHNYCLLKLNRCMKHAIMKNLVPRNIRAARKHAYDVLSIIHTLCPPGHSPDMSREPPYLSAASLVFSGRAALAAADVVSAGEHERDLGTARSSIEGVLPYLNHLATFWPVDAAAQLRTCRVRACALENVMRRPINSRLGCWVGQKWGMLESLEQDLAAEDDCIYGLDDLEYYTLLGLDQPQGATTATMASTAQPQLHQHVSSRGAAS